MGRLENIENAKAQRRKGKGFLDCDSLSREWRGNHGAFASSRIPQNLIRAGFQKRVCRLDARRAGRFGEPDHRPRNRPTNAKPGAISAAKSKPPSAAEPLGEEQAPLLADGDATPQDGDPSAAELLVRRTTFALSASIAYISQLPSRTDENAILRPSGDQDGDKSWSELFVS